MQRPEATKANGMVSLRAALRKKDREPTRACAKVRYDSWFYGGIAQLVEQLTLNQ